MLKTDPEGNFIDPVGDQRVADGYRRWQPGDRVYWRTHGGGWKCGEVADVSDVLRVLEAATGRLWQLSEDEVLRNYPRGDE
jgi:hypothetical protein